MNGGICQLPLVLYETPAGFYPVTVILPPSLAGDHCYGGVDAVEVIETRANWFGHGPMFTEEWGMCLASGPVQRESFVLPPSIHFSDNPSTISHFQGHREQITHHQRARSAAPADTSRRAWAVRVARGRSAAVGASASATAAADGRIRPRSAVRDNRLWISHPRLVECDRGRHTVVG